MDRHATLPNGQRGLGSALRDRPVGPQQLCRQERAQTIVLYAEQQSVQPMSASNHGGYRLPQMRNVHLVRDTFAATVTLFQGVSIEIISKPFSRTSIRTTRIYAEVTHARLDHDRACLERALTSKHPVRNAQNGENRKTYRINRKWMVLLGYEL